MHVFLSSSKLSLLSLCYLSYNPRFSRLFRIACFAWRSCFCFVVIIYHFILIFVWLVILFCTAFFLFSSSRLVSSLLSCHCLCFNTLCSFSFFRLCYGTSASPSSVSVSPLSLCFPFFLLTINYTITGRPFRHQRHCSLHDTMYVIVSVFGIDIDRKRVLHHSLLVPRFIFCD